MPKVPHALCCYLALAGNPHFNRVEISIRGVPSDRSETFPPFDLFLIR
jgi:hypothetical protein